MINEYFKNFIESDNSCEIVKENDASILFDYAILYKSQNNENNSIKLNCIFFYDKEDISYFQIKIPVIDTISNNNLDKINELNRKYKVGKFVAEGNDISIIIDNFVYSYDNINLLFKRMLTLAQDLYIAYNR